MKVKFIPLLLTLALLGTALRLDAQAVIPRYGMFTAAWTLPNQTGNPFDPAQNDIDVVFHCPGQRSVRVPAFWDGNIWRVRYTPEQVGAYSLSVLRSGLPAKPMGLTASHFRCIPSKSPGFLQTDPAHIQHFVFMDGQPFYPFGMDQAWGGGGVPDYPAAFQLMHGSGLNWARIWMTFWDGKALEWAPSKADNPPIGYFSMAAARKWDAIFQAAAQSHIYIQMTLQHHGQYTNTTDPNWSENPYNVANGGFLKQPQHFFTNPEAIQLTKAKYRYIVARWGYSTHLMAFELFNEVQNIKEAQPHFQNVVLWHQTMAAYIRSIDVDHHLITTSNSPITDPLAHIGLSYDQIHAYVPDIVSYFSGFHVRPYHVPVFLGEWGPSGTETASFLHDGLWSGIMIPTAGAPAYWAWDTVAKNNWWPIFGAAARYASASRMAYQTGLRSGAATTVSSSTQSALSFAPTLGWANTTSSDVRLEPDGRIIGLGGVSSFIQGQGHRAMMPQPIAFHLDCAHPCQFRMQIGSVSQDGATAQLLLDGTVVTTKRYPVTKANINVTDVLSVNVPAGLHIVSVADPGTDWYTVSNITVTDYASALAVLAKGNHHAAFFWAYNRDRSGAHPVSGTIAFPYLAPGHYTMTLWDTNTGQRLGAPVSESASATGLEYHLPALSQDVAGWVVQRKKQ